MGDKNPNWPEANQLAIYKRDRGFELGTTENKSSQLSGAGFEFVISELQVQRSDRSATLPLTTEYKWVNAQFCLCFVFQGERSPL